MPYTYTYTYAMPHPLYSISYLIYLSSFHFLLYLTLLYILSYVHTYCTYYIHTTYTLPYYVGMGVSTDTPLAHLYTMARVLQLADGPDEVHLAALAKSELRKQVPLYSARRNKT